MSLLVRDKTYAERAVCYRNSILSMSVTWIDQSKMVEDRIMQFSPYSFYGMFHPEILTGSP